MDYCEILKKMEEGKIYTASSLGVAPASMTAMTSRGMVEVITNGKPKTYRKIPNNKTFQILEILKTEFNGDYFTIFVEGQRFPMLCSLKGGRVFDCWGKEYNISKAIYLEFGGKKFQL